MFLVILGFFWNWEMRLGGGRAQPRVFVCWTVNLLSECEARCNVTVWHTGSHLSPPPSATAAAGWHLAPDSHRRDTRCQHEMRCNVISWPVHNYKVELHSSEMKTHADRPSTPKLSLSFRPSTARPCKTVRNSLGPRSTSLPSFVALASFAVELSCWLYTQTGKHLKTTNLRQGSWSRRILSTVHTPQWFKFR